MRSLSVFSTVSVLVTGAAARVLKAPVPEPMSAEIKDYAKPATFHQLIDHNNPDLGTFSQRYWYNDEWWNGEGSPVVLFTPGEVAADRYTSYLTENTTTGLFGKETDGAVILLEHRYWGESSPFKDLTAETLQYLTLEQSIADLTHFAKTVDLPFDTDHSSNANNAPWVISGGSYSGALAAWTESTSPGTFWAYHASSAPVEAIYDYWRYFAPVKEGMPANCSKDINRVVQHVDEVGQTGSDEEKAQLKKMFGLEDLEHFDDFAGALEWGPWLWQSNTFTTGYSRFYRFCDAVENVEPGAAQTPGPDGVGLEKALQGYGNWFKELFLPGFCRTSYGYWEDENSVECFNYHNASNLMYTDTSPSNTFDRTWIWFCCNEPLFYWQSAAPEEQSTLVSRIISAEWFQEQCPLWFPEVNGYTYGSAKNKTAADVNDWTGGWTERKTKRLIYANGQYDPWRESGVSATGRPGGPMESTPETPVLMVPGGFHTSDLSLRNGRANAGVMKVINKEVAQIKEWVAEYYDQGEEC